VDLRVDLRRAKKSSPRPLRFLRRIGVAMGACAAPSARGRRSIRVQFAAAIPRTLRAGGRNPARQNLHSATLHAGGNLDGAPARRSLGCVPISFGARPLCLSLAEKVSSA
jgi:nitroreductase